LRQDVHLVDDDLVMMLLLLLMMMVVLVLLLMLMLLLMVKMNVQGARLWGRRDGGRELWQAVRLRRLGHRDAREREERVRGRVGIEGFEVVGLLSHDTRARR